MSKLLQICVKRVKKSLQIFGPVTFDRSDFTDLMFLFKIPPKLSNWDKLFLNIFGFVLIIPSLLNYFWFLLNYNLMPIIVFISFLFILSQSFEKFVSNNGQKDKKVGINNDKPQKVP